MNRRSFIAGASQALAFSLAARTARADVSSEQQPSQASLGAVEQRVATVLQAFDAQGNHRAGTAADKASAEWLADQVQQLGIVASLEPFALTRVDPQVAYVRIGNRRIDGVPMFDGSFTIADGVSGRLGPLNSDAGIGLAETVAVNVAQTAEADIIPAARRSRHRAVILVTGAVRPGLFLSNAPAFLNPAGPPMLQVSNVEGAWLQQRAQEHTDVTLVAAIERIQAQAINVIAMISGPRPESRPIGFYGATQRLVAVRERAGQSPCLLAGNHAIAGRVQALARLPFRGNERTRTRLHGNESLSRTPPRVNQTR